MTRILIVGAGIAGLAAARALHLRGFEPELVERAPSFRTTGGGIAVQPNGLCVLHALGLGVDAEHAGTRIRHWNFADARGGRLSRTDLDALWGTEAPFIGIARHELCRILVDGARATPCRLGVSVESLSQSDGLVSVRFSDGSEREYDLVVGSDGVHSTVRALAFASGDIIRAGQTAWRTLARCRPGGDELTFFVGDASFFGLCPVGDGSTYGFANVSEPGLPDDVAGRLGRLRARFASYGRPVQDFLDSIESDEQIHCSSIEWIAEQVWSTRRIVLIGDAAHACLPMMGQGGSMALEDACVLAESLALATDVDTAVEAFVARRRPRIDWVRRESEAAGRSIALPSEARNAVLRERGDALLRARYEPLREPP